VSGRTSQLASFVKADARLMLLPERWEVVACSAVVVKQHTDLAAAVDKAIQQMIDSGEIAELAKKWGLDI
jgi:ABC-type amino acid transport substrate-binding protein